MRVGMTPEDQRAESVKLLRAMADQVERGEDCGYKLTTVIHHTDVYNTELGMVDDARYMGTTVVLSTLPLGVVAAELGKRYQHENGVQFGSHR